MSYKDYFLQPAETSHRRYEILRAVCLEEQSMKDVALRFDVSYGSVRNWVSEFRRQRDLQQTPPFLFRRREDAPWRTCRLTTILKSTWLMFARCHSRWEGDCRHGTQVSTCSCRC